MRVWNNRLNTIGVGSGSFSNHHYSVSDGVLSYTGSPSYSVHMPQRTSPMDVSLTGESRSETSWFPRSTERQYHFGPTAESPSFGSPFSHSGSLNFEVTTKQPYSFPTCNISCRRSYMSKAIYPLVFRNPVSDCKNLNNTEISSDSRSTYSNDRASPSLWLDNNLSAENMVFKSPAELQRSAISPDASVSSQRDGLRSSGASSYDFGFDEDMFNIANHIDPKPRAEVQKCGVCRKLLSQKSPWCSLRIVRSNDMPTAGVLSCCHVFHAECLEQANPKSQVHDPPCPVCLKAIEESTPITESLQMALRSLRKSSVVAATPESPGKLGNYINQSHLKKSLDDRDSSMSSRLKRHLTCKLKASKEIFRNTSSSSS